ncbi:alpha/beta hydrolase family protein [Leptospira inadai serovar Lyme str. 10]|uniref:Alpha/beta hydrolase family protein n=2 Tax=Leptospira inadai serovar Lyme TaxID=293084 RepID=V6HA32_9LEPT|nr:alpha/beta hydrolase [Leptospira inadai]EQA35153.1 alpha/beta hydrolase family protein [Leptospira inadai serovar Lyme str. 10]PNV75391.1 alpha/beta hydrolase [Leptospira inadai serovar Lyme]
MRLYSILGIFIFIPFLLLFGIGFLLYYNQSKLIFFPESLPKDFKYSFQFPYEEIAIDLPEGEKIYALYFQASPNPKGTILYFHGNAGSLRTWGGISEDILPNGWNLLMTDYRGYGKSRARLTELGMYEDAERWYSYLQNRIGSPEDRIVIYGRSIGTAIAVDLATKKSPRTVILETPYTTLADLAAIYYPILPSWLLSFKLDSRSKISNVSSPIHIFHGTEDEIIPFSQGNDLYKTAIKNGKKAELIRIQGGSHNDLSFFSKYKLELKRILAH